MTGQIGFRKNGKGTSLGTFDPRTGQLQPRPQPQQETEEERRRRLAEEQRRQQKGGR